MADLDSNRHPQTRLHVALVDAAIDALLAQTFAELPDAI